MKSAFLFLWLALGWLQPASYAQPRPAAPRPLNVAFVVYPGVEALDLSGPLDVLLKANRLTSNAYRCYTVALSDAALATEQGGLHLRPDYTFQTMPKPDLLVVPGTSPDRIRQLLAQPAGQPTTLTGQLRAQAAHTPLVLSVCTGALLLAKAGVLDGRRATTHWAMLDTLGRRFPRVQVVRGVRYVADEPVLTTAGVTAGIDGALYVVEKYSGQLVADAVARALEYKRLGAGSPAPTGPKTTAAPPKHMAMPMPRAALGKPTANGPAAAPLAAASDPVCHMAAPPTTAHRFLYRGKHYGFCSESCRRIFAAKPEQYVP